MTRARRRKVRSQQPLRAPLASFSGAEGLGARGVSKTYSAHGWPDRLRIDPMKHARSTAYVLDRARVALGPMLRTLDAFGIGPAARAIVVIESALVRPTLAQLRDAHDQAQEHSDVFEPGELVDLTSLVQRLSDAEGDFVAVIPLAVLPDLIVAASNALNELLRAGDFVPVPTLLDEAEQVGAPLFVATRFGASLEDLTGRSL